jgi:hypothetical protein
MTITHGYGEAAAGPGIFSFLYIFIHGRFNLVLVQQWSFALDKTTDLELDLVSIRLISLNQMAMCCD